MSYVIKKIVMLKKFSIPYFKMFRRLISIGHQQSRLNRFGEIMRRNFYKDDADKPLWLPGGGLDKLQGGIKEEKYFNDHELELLAQMRANGLIKLKCESSFGNWTEYEKVANANSENEAIRQTCAHSRIKDCKEEAYFMNEQTNYLKILSGKIKQNKGSLVGQVKQAMLDFDDLKKT